MASIQKLYDEWVSLSRKLIRRLNWKGLFVEARPGQLPIAVLAGYTRSGTTFLGRLMSNVLQSRPVHEPLNPNETREISFFNPRESITTIKSSPRHRDALLAVFSGRFRGTRYHNTGTRLYYRGRIVKIVRANHYLDYLSELLSDCPFVVIMRNPCACVGSRLRAGWPVPDHSHCIEDIEPFLSADQLALYRNAEGIAERMAISWCLDNFMLLRNAGRANFVFVHYEDVLLHSESVMTQIFAHLKVNIPLNRLRSELRHESRGGNVVTYLSRWKNDVNESDIAAVSNVLKVFGLQHYYDLKTGLPRGEAPFLSFGAVT